MEFVTLALHVYLSLLAILSMDKYMTYDDDQLDRNNLAQVARINFYRLDLSSSLQNISKNVYG